jgi:hypothetical protein
LDEDEYEYEEDEVIKEDIDKDEFKEGGQPEKDKSLYLSL